MALKTDIKYFFFFLIGYYQVAHRIQSATFPTAVTKCRGNTFSILPPLFLYHPKFYVTFLSVLHIIICHKNGKMQHIHWFTKFYMPLGVTNMNLKYGDRMQLKFFLLKTVLSLTQYVLNFGKRAARPIGDAAECTWPVGRNTLIRKGYVSTKTSIFSDSLLQKITNNVSGFLHHNLNGSFF